MSLRLRLILVTLGLVTLVAVALSALYLDSLVDSLATEAIDRSDFAAQQVNTFLADHINQHSTAYESPKTIIETKALWTQIASSDPHIPSSLEKLMAASPSILEINVAGRDGTILVSSHPLRATTSLNRLDSITSLKLGSIYSRIGNVISRRPDYQQTIALGFGAEPVFTIQVVTSNVLLRDQLLPRLQRLLLITAGSMLVALLFTILVTAQAMRPVQRIEQTIDRIASGNFRADPQEGSGAAKEFRVMESKLNLLGQQMRGVRQDASTLRTNVDQLLERMANELDVATRLTAISKLTSGVAHEIKNPLNAIVLRLDLLRERLGEPEEELQKEIDILSREALRLDRVVKTFLDFSRPVEVHLKDLDLTALVRDVTELVAPQAKASGMEMTFESSTEPAYIRGDADMLKQATLNLVTNGIEAMQPGGKLKLTVEQQGGRVHFRVADTGPGIPPEARSKVFQLYFTTKKKGSGIGLAMTYRAVQLHNGTIQFTTEVGQGTEFHLEFPASVRSGETIKT